MTHHLDDLVSQRLVDRLTVTEGKRVIGAPPMELGTAFTPIGSLPFAQRVGRWTFFVAAALETKRQSPADARLPVHRTLACLERATVQGAARAAREVGTIE